MKIEYPDKAKEGLCSTEFPTYDGKFYVPDGFEDASLADDWVSCPRIIDKKAILVIRQDYAYTDRRVMGDQRYRVDVCRKELLNAGYEVAQPFFASVFYPGYEDGVQPLFASDSFDEALDFAKDFIEEYIAKERREKILSYSNPKTRNAYDDFMDKAHAVAMDRMTDQSIYLHKDDDTMEAVAMMLLEKKYSKSAIFRAFRDCSPLTAYPGEEDSLAKQILDAVERQGAKKYVTYEFLAHLSKQRGGTR